MEIVRIERGGYVEFGYVKSSTPSSRVFIRHREDGPAVILPDKEEQWFLNGNFHREDGPAVISKINSYRKYCRHGRLHREDGPAYISADESTKRWYIDGRLHRENGPAIVSSDKIQYFLQGVNVPEISVMNPESQDINEMLKHENLEVKRICIERYGWEKMLTKGVAKIIDENRNDIEQTTEFLCDLHSMRLFVGACPSTARIFVMQVPETVTKCIDARAYLSNQDPNKCIGAS